MGEPTPVSWEPLSGLPRASGFPSVSGISRNQTEDFQVQEVLGFAPEGDGEHVLLHIRKRDTNTDWLARQIGRFAGVPEVDVGYAGLKDRRAETSQWFSVRLASRPEPDWAQLESPQVQLLERGRHHKKLRRGGLKGNRFLLRVKELRGEIDSLSERLEHIRRDGVPNYFGEQRFGRDYANLDRVDDLFAGRLSRVGRHKRGLYLSSARSQLFNQVLAARIRQGCWNRPLAGDLLLDGADGRFPFGGEDPDLEQAVLRLELHPSGPMWGRGRAPVSELAGEIEEEALAGFAAWKHGLEHCGLNQERRALRVVALDLNWALTGPDELQLSFFLPPGSYATVLLRELADVSEAPDQRPE